MLDIEIRRPTKEDVENLHQFFTIVITDTFQKEGIGDQVYDIQQEIETKKAYIKSDLESGGNKRYFLIATLHNEIIASIEYGPVSELIIECTHGAFQDLIEVGTVFVHPNHQRQGIGVRMLEAMNQQLKKQGIREYCLDSGYKTAQQIWQNMFGVPDYLMKDYWDEGFHHMIWKIKI
ncbi:Acetyltransferase (GNAT) family protein [Bacillus sp. THAF10]|uniref:GNAT family N-acetyltransferase n=1 Tax=Bacillus sp. THAF10 TaxID=2587848 RepID=UPI0012689322|nr:GNAT family N-acetyltransferase [Bacillus sp. THAF10]QFT89537.1 Acetyltransferase (GNAT) family protein [Bacillus sp. THAF10]